MNKLIKEYKSLVIFMIVVVICFIVGVYKSQKEQEIIRQETYKNCIKEADNYMREAMKDFDDIYSGYTYLIKKDSFTKTKNGYCLDVEIREDNKTLDTLNFKFDNKVNDTVWIPDYEKLDNEIKNLLDVGKEKHNPVSKAVNSLYKKYARPLIDKGCKVECRLLNNDYEKDGTISWMVSYKKKNLKTSHFQQYSVKVNSDGSYQIIDTTEA